MRLELTADELLTTTRAVRKRLDLERPVEREVVEECLELAMQAPTGGMRQGWHWMLVTDPAKKKRLAELYADGVSRMYDLSATDDSGLGSAVRDSAAYLVDHFHEVPVILLPCHEGRVDGQPSWRQAGYWGSLLPAVWSFMLALRSRGLGSAWTTLHLCHEQEVAELLGIPYETMTQGGMMPVAYTKGTDFKRASRRPVAEVVHWDTW